MEGIDSAHFQIDANTGIFRFKTPPSFLSPKDENDDNIYEFTAKVADDNNLFDLQKFKISIRPNEIISCSENSLNVTTVRPIDASISNPTYSIIDGSDKSLFNIDEENGGLKFNISPDFESPHDSNSDNIYVVVVSVENSNGYKDEQSFTITVLDIDELPIISSNSGVDETSLSVSENDSSVCKIEATDQDEGTLSYSIVNGDDLQLFSINPSNGNLVFQNQPNFENPTDVNANNVYEVVVRVTDSTGLFDEQKINVEVSDQDEPPIISSNSGVEETLLSVFENDSFVCKIEATDQDGGTLSYSISSVDDFELFSINPSSGDLVFQSPPDFESPTDVNTNNVYEVVVRVTDSTGLIDEQKINVEVLNQLEPKFNSFNGSNSVVIQAEEYRKIVANLSASDNVSDNVRFSISGASTKTYSR